MIGNNLTCSYLRRRVRREQEITWKEADTAYIRALKIVMRGLNFKLSATSH